METLFGGELPLAGRLLFFLLIVLGLFGAVIWVVRRFGGERLGGATGRGRQPRLALIEFAALGDGRRRLILIRRDNVEHLLMIGGPTDVVVEANIVRAAGAAREAPAAGAVRSPVPEAAPVRQAPAPEPSPWPLQPEPAPRPQRIPAPPVAEDSDRWLEPEPPAVPPAPPRRQPRPPIADRPVDPLAGLAAELARATEPVRGPAGVDTDAGSFAPPPAREARVPREPMRPRATPTRQPAPVAREPEPSSPGPEEVMPEREAPRLREPQAPAAAPAEPTLDASADQNLAEMAQRLEAALRRPARPNEPRPADTPRSPESDNGQPTPVAIPATAPARAAGEAAPEHGEPKPSKSLYDNLEKEMASLLGRPGGKT